MTGTGMTGAVRGMGVLNCAEQVVGAFGCRSSHPDIETHDAR